MIEKHNKIIKESKNDNALFFENKFMNTDNDMAEAA